MFSNAEAIYFSFEFDVVCENSRCLVVVVTLLPKSGRCMYTKWRCAFDGVYVSWYVRTRPHHMCLSLYIVLMQVRSCGFLATSAVLSLYWCVCVLMSLCFILAFTVHKIEPFLLSSYGCVRWIHQHIWQSWACICFDVFIQLNYKQTIMIVRFIPILWMYLYTNSECNIKMLRLIEPINSRGPRERARRFSTVSTIRRCSAMHKMYKCIVLILSFDKFVFIYSNQEKNTLTRAPIHGHRDVYPCSRIPRLRFVVRVKLSFGFYETLCVHFTHQQSNQIQL